MSFPTALELVNRVLQRMRDETVGNFADDRAQVVLDYVNAAKEDVLTSRDWKDDIRHDGVLFTVSPITSTTGQLVSGSQAFSDGAFVISGGANVANDFNGDLISRFEYQGDATTSLEQASMVGTHWRIRWIQEIGSVGVGNTDFVWTGESTSTAKLKFFVSEYLMPSTVREVVSITHQNGIPLKLDHIDAGASFDQAFPDMAERYAKPETVAVGGFDIPTGFAQESDPRLRMILFPIPDGEYRLNYSYYYDHPRLADPADVLQVANKVADSIVEKATADAIQGIQQRVSDGQAMAAQAERRVMNKHGSHDPQPARRHVIGSWSDGSSGRGLRRGLDGVISG